MDTQTKAAHVFGTAQPCRLAPAFDPSTAPIDDRTEMELLAFAPQLASLIHYRNWDNKVEGSFDPLFTSDPRISLAVIVATPVAREKEAMEVLAGQIQNPSGNSSQEADEPAAANSYARFHDLLTRLYSLCARVNTWNTGFPRDTAADGFLANVQTVISQEMAVPFAELRSYWKAAQAAPLPGFAGFPREPVDLGSFDPSLWQLNRPLPSFSFRDKPVPLRAVVPVFRTLSHWESTLVQSARESLKLFPSAPHNLPPQTALYTAFLEVFALAREELNKLTGRHLDFYYEQILLQTKRKEIPDKALVSFELNPKVPGQFLPAGTQLSAGKDADGNSILYATLEDFQVNNMCLAQISTQWVGQTHDASLGVYVAPVANSAHGTGPAFTDGTSWPGFGENQDSFTSEDERTMQDGVVGFAVSAPILELSEGTRTLLLRFSVVGIEHGQPAALPQSGLQAQLSGPTGWVNVSLQPAADGSPDTYQITLRPEDPPIVPFKASVLGGPFDERWPVIRFLLDPAGGNYLQSPFKTLKLSGLAITVQVNGLKTLDLYNASGRVASGKPFQPFGSAPPCGSVLSIGSSEVFRKDLFWLQLHADWLDLPNTALYPGGFASYYSGYAPLLQDTTLAPVIVFTNTVFQVEFTCLYRGVWRSFQNLKAGTPATFTLFDPDLANPNAYTLQSSGTGPIQTGDPSLPSGPLTLDSKTLGGFMGVRLTQPSYGFGQTLYPQAVSRTALENAEILIQKFQPPKTLKEEAEQEAEKAVEEVEEDAGSVFHQFWNWLAGKKKAAAPATPTVPPAPAPAAPPQEDPPPKNPQPLPNPPYTPTLSSLTLDYQAQATLDFTANTQESSYRFYQIGAFTTYEATKPLPELLPQLNSGGYLFLGFTPQDTPVSVSVLFQIQERAGGCALGNTVPDQGIHWCYLANDAWTPFEPHGVGDQTEELKKSGLLTFSLPSAATSANETMPGSLLWICGGVADADAFSRLVALSPQAIHCQWVPGGDVRAHLQQPLPAGSIQSLLPPVPAIKKVSQPLPSSGGHPPEDSRMFHSRVSERLRHKQRAWQSWDYERLVLEECPDVFCAKCLPLTAPDPSGKSYQSNVTGSVLVLVLPRFYTPPAAAAYPPGLTQSRLEEIREFLVAQASPFVTIAVANPRYREVLVTAQVKFKAGTNPVKGSTQLNEALRGYLSPWIFQPSLEQPVAAEFAASSLLQFAQTQASVETVAWFEAEILPDPSAPDSDVSPTANEGEDGKLVLRPDHPWTVLISAWKHALNTTPAGSP